VGDITYIPTWQGWAYLATVIDCATRKVIGWAVHDNYRTPVITSAIQMAARNVDLPAGAIFHSDRGSNLGITLLLSSPLSWTGWESASQSGALGRALTMLSRNRSMLR
jgi:transposase InsO family protein